MAYKIKYHNTFTGEFILGRETYDSYEAAKKSFQKMVLAGEIYDGFMFSGIVSVEEPKPKTPDTVEEDEKEAVYDLSDDGKGKKYDSGKSMVGTLCRVFPRALLGIGQCIEFGTHKYPKPDNWKLVDGAFTRYQDSMMRHYLKFLAGQEQDSETNLLHLKHMAWNALAILELYLMEHNEKDLFI